MSADISLLTQEAPIDPVYSVPTLITIAVAAIAVLLVLIIVVKLHAFYSLVVVSILTALVSGISIDDLLDTITGPFASTLGGVAMLVGFGVVLGRLLEISGGAQVLAESLIQRFGEKRAPLALSVASLLICFPIFYDAALVVMLPLIFQVARRLTGGLLLYGMPVVGAGVTMHALTPPHPGPTAASQIIGVDVGLVVLFGLIVGLPTWYFAGYRLAVFLGHRLPNFPVPNILGKKTDHRANGEILPRFGTVLTLLLLPPVLIVLGTIIDGLGTSGVVPQDAWWTSTIRLIGETPVALLISSLLAMIVLVVVPQRGRFENALEKVVEEALGPVCGIILITGAGGMFGGVLTATGIGDALATVLASTGLPLIVVAFLLALIVRVAQGSATVAATTAAGLIASTVHATGQLSATQLALTVVSIGAGSIALGHVNDSGFWLTTRMFGLSTKDGLRTVTVIGTAVGVVSFLFTCILYGVVSVAGI